LTETASAQPASFLGMLFKDVVRIDRLPSTGLDIA